MKPPLRFLLAAALVAAAPTVPAQAPSPRAATLVPAQSEIVFTTRQMGVPVEGRFTAFTAQVALDPRQPATGSVALSIDTAGTRFGVAETDAEVVKPVWLSATAFPKATFQSTAVRAVGPGRFEVAGRLSIKGTTRDLVVPVSVAQAGGTSTASGSFAIKRLEYRIGEGEWADTSIVANDVQVRFKLVLTGLPPL